MKVTDLPVTGKNYGAKLNQYDLIEFKDWVIVSKHPMTGKAVHN